MRLYRCRDGAFLVVPDCMGPSMVAERTLGPLNLIGGLDIERLPAGVRERAAREIDEDLFSMLRATEVLRHAAAIRAPVPSPTCPVCAIRRGDNAVATSGRARVTSIVGSKFRALKASIEGGILGEAHDRSRRRNGMERRTPTEA